MNKIDYQALRKAAQNYQSTLAWYQSIPDSPNAERDCDAALAAFKHHIRHREVDIISGLLDELDEKQQYIKSRDEENEDIALTVGKLRVELEEVKQHAEELSETNAVRNQWRPDICPITGRAFFMWIEHPTLGNVPTYGGPLDSYTIPTKDGEFSCERYDHDFGGWVESECLGYI